MTLPETPTARVLDWEGCFNVRDLGGLPTLDGRRTRWGALVRSDVLCRLTDAGRTALVDHGVRTIIDLRFPDEVAHDWDTYPFRDAGAGGPGYLNVPFDTGRDPGLAEEIRTAYRAAQTRAELNRLDLDRNASGIAAAVAAIADAPDGGVLVHCHGGKDRTGIVVATILSIVGVSDEDIADDYALTALNMEPLIVEWLDSMSDDAVDRERLRALATPAREAMLDTMAHLKAHHRSAEDYVRGAGVTDVQFARLRTRLLDDG